MPPLCPRDKYLHCFPLQNRSCESMSKDPWGTKARGAELGSGEAKAATSKSLRASLLLTTASIQGWANQRKETRGFHRVAEKTTENKRDIYLCCHKRIQTSLTENVSAGSAHTPGFSRLSQPLHPA